MKEEEIFESTPFLGYYDKTCTKFKDIELFDKSHRNYIRLKKVKIWYGDFGQSDYDDEIYEKNIIGIQCEYLDSISGETKSTDMYCGKISGEDINTKVLDLSNSDYITKFIICFNKIITYIKFQTKNNQIFEVGKFNKDLTKTLKFNLENNTHMIVSFFGYFNNVGLRALGCNYIKRANFIMFFFVDYFRYRRLLKLKDEEMEKWTEEKIKTLTFYEQAFIRICLLPNSLFYKIISYC